MQGGGEGGDMRAADERGPWGSCGCEVDGCTAAWRAVWSERREATFYFNEDTNIGSFKVPSCFAGASQSSGDGDGGGGKCTGGVGEAVGQGAGGGSSGGEVG